jgi:positive regulator of sigma E activity
MDIRGWESLWKVSAIIGIANLFFFFVILFASTLDNSTILWILIAIESTCYLGVLIVRRHIRQLL